MNRPYLINLKDYEQLIALDKIMKTKAGHLWKCGKGYRKDWNKLIGCLVLLHGKSYTLISRQKIDGVWYLTFKDDKYQYTEKQDQALYNKNLAKNAKIEELEAEPIQVTYQLCLPAPVELMHRLYDEAQQYDELLSGHQRWIINSASNNNTILYKLFYIAFIAYLQNNANNVRRSLLRYYHTDNTQSYRHDQVDNTIIAEAFSFIESCV